MPEPLYGSAVTYKTLACVGCPDYEIGSDGTVWSIYKTAGWKKKARRGIWFRKEPTTDHLGRKIVNLRRKTRLVSRLVLTAFVGHPPEGMECCHYDGNPGNNNLENLRWDTHHNNMQDNLRLGTTSRGEHRKNSKLTRESVEQIRREMSLLEGSSRGNKARAARSLAAKYSVATKTVLSAYYGKSWRWYSPSKRIK